jgi:hypothetical protein
VTTTVPSGRNGASTARVSLIAERARIVRPDPIIPPLYQGKTNTNNLHK